MSRTFAQFYIVVTDIVLVSLIDGAQPLNNNLPLFVYHCSGDDFPFFAAYNNAVQQMTIWQMKKIARKKKYRQYRHYYSFCRTKLSRIIFNFCYLPASRLLDHI